MSRPRLLDLFSGAGGCSVGYARAGFDVIGIDLHPQPNYPYEFHQADALEFLRGLIDGHTAAGLALWHFDAIHASPPCQAYSDLAHHPQNKHIDYPDLVGPVRELLIAAGLPYVIENVEGAPLIDPFMFCGTSFGLPLRRHRLFEVTFPLMGPPCAHGAAEKRFSVWRHGREIRSAYVPVYGTGGGKAAEHWPEAMGIDWMTRRELTQAIPPAYTEHIGGYLMSALSLERAA